MLFVENVGIRWLRLETHITHMTHVVLVPCSTTRKDALEMYNS
jgi:hypothetical protein